MLWKIRVVKSPPGADAPRQIVMGTQELVGDIVAGLFIVFEQFYDVGDIILVDGFRGTVRAPGIRMTQIEDEGGNVQVVNNSALGNFINMTAKCP